MPRHGFVNISSVYINNELCIDPFCILEGEIDIEAGKIKILCVDYIKEDTPGAGVGIEGIHIDGNIITTYPGVGSGNIRFQPSGNITLAPSGSGQVLLGADPTSPLGAATKQYVDSILVSGQSSVLKTADYKTAIALSTSVTPSGTGVGKTLTNSGTQAPLSVDGTLVTIGDRILVDNGGGTTGLTNSDNGLYTVTVVGDGSTNWVLTRSTELDQDIEIEEGLLFYIKSGSIYSGRGYVIDTVNPIVIDVTPHTYQEFAGGSGGSADLNILTPVEVVTGAALSSSAISAGTGIGKTITNSGTMEALVIDGITLSSGDRVLIDNGFTTTGLTDVDNGIYTVTVEGDGSTNWVLTRATDADEDSEVTKGIFVFVENGDVFKDTGFILVTNNPITVDTTSLEFRQFATPSLVPGTGIDITNTIISTLTNQNHVTRLGTIIEGTWNVPLNTVTASDYQFGTGTTTLLSHTATVPRNIYLPDNSGTLLIDPTTTKGDILVHQSGNLEILSTQKVTQVLTVSSSSSAGISWSSLPIRLPYGLTNSTSQTEYTIMSTFIYPGSLVYDINSIRVIVRKDTSVTDFQIKVFDSTNVMTIVPDTTVSDSVYTSNIYTLSPISNIPTGEAILEVQMRITGGMGDLHLFYVDID